MEFIRKGIELCASDIHLQEEAPVVYRVDGVLRKSEMFCSAIEMQEIVKKLMNDRQQELFEAQGELDFACSTIYGRLRVNAYKHLFGMALAIRLLPETVPSMETLGLPALCKELVQKGQGLVLVTGPAGAGKSTTLAAMVNYINAHTAKHIITLEDPIEFVYGFGQSLIHQREIQTHSAGFAAGLRAALREDPEVILVGELRDAESIAVALTAAETGHLILGTMHTCDAASSIHRIIDMFPAARQREVCSQLSLVLEAVLSQRLFRKREGGRIAAFEIMMKTSAIQNLIREGKVENLRQYIETGSKFGMQTMAAAIKALEPIIETI